MKQISESASESNVKINKTENVRQKIIKRHPQKYGPLCEAKCDGHANGGIKTKTQNPLLWMSNTENVIGLLLLLLLCWPMLLNFCECTAHHSWCVYCNSLASFTNKWSVCHRESEKSKCTDTHAVRINIWHRAHVIRSLAMTGLIVAFDDFDDVSDGKHRMSEATLTPKNASDTFN